MANEKFIKALKREPQPVPPIWFMRQAGRYHKHYQGLRSKYSFMELCKRADLSAEVTAGPIEDFDFDVAILFSDLLFPLEALGMGLTYEPGPKLGWTLNTETIKNIRSIDDALPGLEFQKDAVKACRERISDEKSLIGFVGGPWTLFTYAVDGGHQGNLIEPKRNMALFQNFCETLVPILKQNIAWQLEAGSEVVMLFDTAAGELDPRLYTQFVAPQLQKLIQAFPGKLGYYAKTACTGHYVHETFKGDEWAGLGFDHRWDLTQTFDIGRGFVQGNFDQALLFNETDDFRKRLDDFLKPFEAMSAEQRAGWVCGLGHGVLPKTPEEHVREFVQTVRERLG